MVAVWPWVVCAGLVLVQAWMWTPLRVIWKCRRQGISGFPYLPLLGQLPRIVADKGLASFLTNCCHCRDAAAPFFFCIGRTVFLVVSDPALVRTVLQHNTQAYAKFFFIQNLGSVLGRGVFSISGHAWARQRRVLTPAFHNKQLKGKVNGIVDCATAAVESWSVNLSGEKQEVDLYRFSLQLTLSVILRVGYGARVGGDSGMGRSILLAFDRYLRCSTEMVFGYAAAIPGYEFLPTILNWQRRKDARVLRMSLKEILRAGVGSSGFEEEGSLVEVMLAAYGDGEGGLSEEEVMDNCMTFLLAGHETTASLVTWSVYLLAKHPAWQERARAEVRQFWPSGEGVDYQSTLSKLQTVSMILWESLRLFPPQPVIGRRCLEENQVGKYVIPAGVEILIPVGVMHRDKRVWGDDSEEFRPDRFANGIHGACSDPAAYLPFGTGPRTCMGQGLAVMEAKVILAVMLSRWCWKLSPHYRHSPETTLSLQPRYGMPVILDVLERM